MVLCAGCFEAAREHGGWEASQGKGQASLRIGQRPAAVSPSRLCTVTGMNLALVDYGVGSTLMVP